jgi:hypothetical protein
MITPDFDDKKKVETKKKCEVKSSIIEILWRNKNASRC